MENNELLQKIEKLEWEVAQLKSSHGFKLFIKRIFNKSSFIIGIVVTAVLTGFLTWAAQIMFTNGTLISATDVNSNFTALYNSSWAVDATGNNIYWNKGNVGIGTTSPSAKLEVAGTVKMFGQWSSAFNIGQEYQAATDGFVLAHTTCSNALGMLSGFTDSTSPPTTLRASADNPGFGPSTQHLSIMMPVRKGDYWIVYSCSPGPVLWLPLGSN